MEEAARLIRGSLSNSGLPVERCYVSPRVRLHRINFYQRVCYIRIRLCDGCTICLGRDLLRQDAAMLNSFAIGLRDITAEAGVADT